MHATAAKVSARPSGLPGKPNCSATSGSTMSCGREACAAVCDAFFKSFSAGYCLYKRRQGLQDAPGFLSDEVFTAQLVGWHGSIDGHCCLASLR